MSAAGSPLIVHGIDALTSAIGRPLGPTGWVTIGQSRIDAFAEATEDRQWIHIDAERARQTPFGTTIAHGYLTLSLTSLFLPQLIQVQGVGMAINYGLDRVRFPTPVRSGCRIRARGEIQAVDSVSEGAQVVVRVTVEVEGSDRPACVADTITRFVFVPS